MEHTLSSLSNHLNGKTQTRKVGVGGILIVEENVVIVTWILAMGFKFFKEYQNIVTVSPFLSSFTYFYLTM